jgi:hypothetical protein
MPVYKTLPRGKAKPHDDFKDWTTRAIIWVRHHWVSAAELLGVGVVALAVVMGASAYGKNRAESGGKALYEAMLLPAGSDEREAALDQIGEKYSRTFAGKAAMMMRGEILLERKDLSKAMGLFQKIADGSRNNSMLRIAALHRMAETELTAGDPGAAAKTYRKAAADPGNRIPLRSELMAAACLEKAGDYEAAAELYRRIKDDAGEGDRQASEASEERLLWLHSKGKISG